ncbi:helix-turn-helix domain-containing protein [Paenibacillus eucommiae]|uniref:Transcriptional regulator with XRE-family HTH domain n=1 Tax=Paenibacillus eucommiae TaxID=1355755 RepID=A0ABS4IVQ5_9BACL|nr:helix-turn-helix transcriptional regulator [Paenibacillus eucommiae]MBP1991668.1 transcriptional regulator with XRE-family HTH domain [Paenibacillus eucommiae]
MFGKRLAEIRNSKGISQYELADRLKFTRTQLANYEQGKREPDFTTLITLADYFNVSLDYLLGRTDQKSIKSEKIMQNVLIYGREKENLTPEEADYLKENLYMLRKYKALWRLKEEN